MASGSAATSQLDETFQPKAKVAKPFYLQLSNIDHAFGTRGRMVVPSPPPSRHHR